MERERARRQSQQSLGRLAHAHMLIIATWGEDGMRVVITQTQTHPSPEIVGTSEEVVANQIKTGKVGVCMLASLGSHRAHTMNGLAVSPPAHGLSGIELQRFGYQYFKNMETGGSEA